MNINEFVSLVDGYDLSDHCGNNDHFSTMGFYSLLMRHNFGEQLLLCVSLSAFNTTALTCRKKICKLREREHLKLFHCFSAKRKFFCHLLPLTTSRPTGCDFSNFSTGRIIS